MCLFLKSLTKLFQVRQIKDEEMFDHWDKIQQYLSSEQGGFQVQQCQLLGQLLPTSFQQIDMKTLFILEELMF